MPQVQFLDIPTWGDVLGKVGSGVLGAYDQSREDKGLENIIGDIKKRQQGGETDEDIIMSIYGQKGVPFEKKKSLVDIYSKAKENTLQMNLLQERQKKEQKREERAREEFESKKQLKERELDIKEKSLTGKKEPKTEYQKEIEKLTAKSQVEMFNELPEVESAIRTSNQLGSLIEETTGLGTVNIRKSNELKVAAAALLKPMIKVYNPSGVVSQPKLNWITERFGINPYEPRWSQRGKLDGIKNLLNEQKLRIIERGKLFDQWNGNPPMEQIREFDDESEKVYDQMTGWNKKAESLGTPIEAPKSIQEQLKNAPKDRVIKDSKGNKYKWDGDKWLQA